MRFLIDAQLPPALAHLCRKMGHEADHVLDLHLEKADDERIWKEVQTLQAVLVTKDEDFSNLLRIRPSKQFVVWIRYGNCTNKMLLERFLKVLPEIIDRLNQGEQLIELI